MISSQRILMLMIMINVVISLAGGALTDPTIFEPTTLTDQTLFIEESEQETIKESYQWGGNNEGDKLGETTAGNTMAMTGQIMKWLLKGISPIPVTQRETSHPVTKMLILMLETFRIMTVALIVLEVVLILKNKKNT